ncbi:LexA family protein [Brevundimonas sp. GN22]
MQKILIPLMGPSVCAGFPSPADDYVEEALDPAQLLVTNPISTFMWRVSGNSMRDAGILDGGYVVVDRSLKPRCGDVVIAVIDGQASVKRLSRSSEGTMSLQFANTDMLPLKLDEASEASIWGVVTWSLTPHRAVVR